MPKVTRPVAIALPAHGVAFAESAHADNFRAPLRADPFHKLLYVVGGRAALRDPHTGRETAAPAGALLLVERGAAHALRDEQPATLLLLCLAPRWIAAEPARAALWRALATQRAWRVPPGRPGSRRFENLWRRALLEQGAASPGTTVALHALAAQILVALARLPVAARRTDDAAARVRAAAREIAETFYDDWTLDRAAARAGLSRRRFSELFRAHTGATFLAALTARRLAHAAALLRGGAHSVAGAAFSCGYRDLSPFYRAFRKRFGAPPGEWMAARR